jgi:hypothetical protein
MIPSRGSQKGSNLIVIALLFDAHAYNTRLCCDHDTEQNLGKAYPDSL